MKAGLKISFVALFCSLHSYGQPEAIWQLLQNGQIVRWVYSFGDEFSGTSLDETKWQNTYGWGRNFDGPLNHVEYMTDGQNMVINNGTLKLIAKKEDILARGIWYEPDNFLLNDGSLNLQWWHYTSGMIFSKQKFKYGLFEIRFKIPVGTGLFPAFWLYGGNPNEEFDIFECKGERTNQLHWDVHCPKGCGDKTGGWATASSGNFSSGFNTLMGEWGPGALYWYCNGQEFAGWLGDLNYQAHLLANLNLNGPFGPFPPGVNSSTPYPSAFEIDYIRVWTKVNCRQTLNICSYNQTPTSLNVLTGGQITLGGSSLCSVNLNEGENLDLIATDYIELLSGADIDGLFSTKIVDCPGPKSMGNSGGADAFPGNSDNYGDVVLDDASKEKSLNTESKHLFYTKIYPNPTQGRINIEFDGKIVGDVEIKLINNLDQTVFVKKSIKENFYIDISELPKGVYFLTGTFGENSISEKIVLE
jgi:beta-glucanase (GH16 family)